MGRDYELGAVAGAQLDHGAADMVRAVAGLSVNRSAISWLLSLADQGKHLPFALGEHERQDG